MEIQLNSLKRNYDGSPGDILDVRIRQMGDNKDPLDTTDIIIDTDQQHRDIRITDGSKTIKIRLDENYEIRDLFENDVQLTPQMRD